MKRISDIRQYLNARKYIREFAVTYAEKKGVDPKKVEQDILRAKPENHISLSEYEWTGYYDRSMEEKRTISTLWTRMEFRRAFTDRRYIGMLMNKYIFSKVFSDFYGRRCIHSSEVNEAALQRLAVDIPQVVYKPNCKGMGQGIRVLPVGTREEREEAIRYIREGGSGIIEEYICQEETLDRLYPNAVNIIRFYSVSSPEGMFLFAPVLTVAHEKQISNGCKDALTSLVDIRTGQVLTDAVDQNHGEVYKTHPVTGEAFQGLQIPAWEETIQMMKKAVSLGSRISNIGWDVAITKTGPLLIEANTIPGFMTAQFADFRWVTEGYGYQPLFDAVHGTGVQEDRRFQRTVLRLG